MDIPLLSSKCISSVERHRWYGSSFLLMLLPILFLLGTSIASAQTPQLETDKGLLQSIAPYNADVRRSILIASQNTRVLEQAQQIRNRSQRAFQNLIGGYSQQEQGYFYEITRYPAVLRTMATTPDLRRNEVEDLLNNTSAILRENGWALYRNNRGVLSQMYQLNQDAEYAYQQMLQPLDITTQTAFRQLANYPDVMALLSENMDLTVRLGERYYRSPEALNLELANMHDEMVAQRQYEVAEYKRKINDDPDAARELDQAATEYAQSNNYVLPNRNQDVYITNNYYYSNPNTYYYSNPYSYWCGYPHWYTTPLWYPNAYWVDFRVSFGIGSIGFYGCPSYGFANWFYYGGYYRRYPSLYARFGNYYRNYVNYYYGNPSRYYYAGRANPYRNYDRGYYNNRDYDRNMNANRGGYYNNKPNYENRDYDRDRVQRGYNNNTPRERSYSPDNNQNQNRNWDWNNRSAEGSNRGGRPSGGYNESPQPRSGGNGYEGGNRGGNPNGSSNGSPQPRSEGNGYEGGNRGGNPNGPSNGGSQPQGGGNGYEGGNRGGNPNGSSNGSSQPRSGGNSYEVGNRESRPTGASNGGNTGSSGHAGGEGRSRGPR